MYMLHKLRSLEFFCENSTFIIYYNCFAKTCILKLPSPVGNVLVKVNTQSQVFSTTVFQHPRPVVLSVRCIIIT